VRTGCYIYFKELVEKKINRDVIIEFMTNKETLDTPLYVLFEVKLDGNLKISRKDNEDYY
jgi:hypothetical protein